MKYICENPECSHYGEVFEFTHTKFFFKKGELVSEHLECPYCGKDRKEINPNEEIPLSEKEIGYAAYSSASPQDKREMLKKRSHDHFMKEVKPYKEHVLHETVKNFQELSK